MVYRNKMKNIHKNGKGYIIRKTQNKKQKSYGCFKNKEEAIQKRDWLDKNEWNTTHSTQSKQHDYTPQKKLKQLAKQYQKKNTQQHNRMVKTSV